MIRLLIAMFRGLGIRSIIRVNPPQIDRNIAVLYEAVDIAETLKAHGPEFQTDVLTEAARVLGLNPWRSTATTQEVDHVRVVDPQ